MISHAHDTRRSAGVGLALALASATSFGLSGVLARGLIEAGWSPGAAVTARILLGAVLLALPAVWVLRGRWGLLRGHGGVLGLYGLLAVAGCQLCFFQAVRHLPVGVALLIEYTAPVAVVGWWWLRHGQPPGRLTVAGAGLAGLGLVGVLDILGGAQVSLPGVLWALGAMVGVAVYFVVSADERVALPPLVLAAGGLVVGGLALVLAGGLGWLTMTVGTQPVRYAEQTVPSWLPVLGLGLVTTALAYTTGIAAGRRLGSRLASFVGLWEVVAAMLFAWLLLGQLPAAGQLLGGLAILAGVVVVRLGEPTARSAGTDPQAAAVSGRPVAAGRPPA